MIKSLDEAMRIRALPPIYSTSSTSSEELARRLADPKAREMRQLKQAAERFIREEFERRMRAISLLQDQPNPDRAEIKALVMALMDELKPSRDPLDDTMSTMMGAELSGLPRSSTF